MKKYLLYITFLVGILLFTFALCASATDVYIDGIKVQFNASTGYPFVQNGRTLVPLRATMESFGATVEWETDTSTAVVRKGTTTVRCKIGDYFTYRNNVKIANDAAAIETGGRTYLPIRTVLESFGAKVDWNGNVIVTSPGAASLIQTIESTPSVTKNYWKIWNDALNQKQYGNYQACIDKIFSISNAFLNDNKTSSCAMLYKHLGECYSALGNYANASACFKKEAYYWALTAGMNESRIDAERRSNLISTNTQIYIKNTDPQMGAKTYFGKPHEPQGGICLGAYAEGDTNLHNPWNPSLFYMDTFPALVGKDMAAYLLYMPYGMDLSNYESHFQAAIQKGKIMQIALEPRSGLESISYGDSYLIQLAQKMEQHECRFMLRFAGEMNDTTSLWYNANPNLFIEKFRIVADIFHTYAPSVPVIWAPNHYPPDTIDDYYPGDNYVDYVGMSSYKMHQPITDPLGKGVDRSRWSNQLDTLYSLYGHKKPIIVVEGGASCMDYDTWADITPYASRQIKDFYTYLPIKYPNVKFSFVFNSDRERQKFAMSSRPEYLNAYKEGIQSDLYCTNLYNDYYTYDYYEIGNNVSVKAEPTEFCSYITEPENDVAYVIYYINGVQLGVSYGAPYKVNADFTGYKNQSADVTVKSFNSRHMPITDYTVKVNVN